MNATAPKHQEPVMDETIAHPRADVARGPVARVGEFAAQTCDHSPVEAQEASPQARQPRYTFSSGARPLDGFTIKRAIGRGGFGEVYYATSDAGKEVALKLIVRDLDVETRGVIQCMNLKSPNLIAIHDLRTTEHGDTFVIMEYVAGPSLAQILRQHPNGMPLPQVSAWLSGLVAGVSYLHDHGIVHRDLKPANLFLEEGVVKIGDYGLSKLITGSAGAGQSASVGTCHYMAPEIASGKYHKPIDIYALGVIIYEMLRGQLPFDGESVGEVLMKHLTATPDFSALPEPYRTIVKKAMAKDPKDRQARVEELLGPGAPGTPDLRFIGERAVASPVIAAPIYTISDEPKAKPDASEDEILLISDEEEIFYIGPDTRPPRTRNGLAGWFAGKRANRTPSRPAAPKTVERKVQRVAAPTPVVPRRPIAPPEPPPVVGGRVRVAELATSMLCATPMVGLFGMAASSAFGDNIPQQPHLLASLIGVTLYCTWATLVAGKFFDGKQFDAMTKRIVFLVMGVLMGGMAFVLSDWTQIGPVTTPSPVHISVEDGFDVAFQVPNVVQLLSFFGLAFFALNWTGLTARDRPKRFRFLPVILAALVAAILTPFFWPMDRPWGAAVLVLTSIVVQLASPWSEAAAKYAAWRPKRVA